MTLEGEPLDMSEHIITAKEVRELQAMSNNPVNRELTKIRAQLEDFVNRNKYERFLSVPINLEGINDKDLELIEEILEENGFKFYVRCALGEDVREKYSDFLGDRKVIEFINKYGYGSCHTLGIFCEKFYHLTEKQREILEPNLAYRIYW